MQGMPFGDLLKMLRKKKRLSQQALAEKLGVHRNTIWGWEQGNYLPDSRGMVVELARQLSLDEQEMRQLLEGSLTSVSSYWHVPFGRNPFFTGRPWVFQQLEAGQATGTWSYALRGLGGIGKTQFAVEYAYRHRYDYSAVLWVEAETRTTLTTSFVALAHLLSLSEKSEEDQNKVIAAVLRWLNHHKGWLLIFDNVEDLADLKPFLPGSEQGALLFTTRLQTLGPVAPTIELWPMTRDEGVDFLLARINLYQHNADRASIKPQEQNTAEKIVAAMGGLPLALEQAGAYIDATQCGLLDYYDLLQHSQYHLLHVHDPASDHPFSVGKTFALAFERLRQGNRAAAELLTVCAFLAPEAIPETIFLAGASALGSTFEAMARDLLLFQQALKSLLSYSLLQRTTSNHTVNIHRLVQTLLRRGLSEGDEGVWAQRIVKALYDLFPFDEQTQADYWPVCDQLLPHALVCIELGEQWVQDKHLTLSLIDHVAIYLTKRARYAEAEELLLPAVRAGEQVLGPHHPFLADVLHELANAYFEQGNYEQAEPLFQRALDIREQARGTDHFSVAETLYRLGILAFERSVYTKAEAYFQRALLIVEQGLGPDHPQLAYSLNGLGLLYWQQGKYEQAEAFYQHALHIREQSQGSSHPQVVTPLTNLGLLYYEQGKYEQAEAYIQRALLIVEKGLGLDHPEASLLFTNQGNIYYEQGKYEQAEAHYQRAVQILERTKGPHHTDLTIPIDNLAETYTKQGKYEQAEAYYRRALHILEKEFGAQHLRVAYSLHGLANVYLEQGRYEESLPLYDRVLELRQQHKGLNHPETADTLYDLARFHQMQQQIPEASLFYQQALMIREQILGPKHPKTQEAREAYTSLREDGLEASPGFGLLEY